MVLLICKCKSTEGTDRLRQKFAGRGEPRLRAGEFDADRHCHERDEKPIERKGEFYCEEEKQYCRHDLYGAGLGPLRFIDIGRLCVSGARSGADL